MEKTLLIMAAGMGSRYGGNKQIDGMGPHNEILMEYSVYDAIHAGFTKVVFIIKRDFSEFFKENFGNKIAKCIPVEYVYQDMNDLPEGCTVDERRTKPLGTVQAILAARHVIHEPFCVLNADDYYGTNALPTMSGHLEKLGSDAHGCMVGYYLKNTVSENGHVTRGICHSDEQNHLLSVTETYKIQTFPDGSIRDTEKDSNGVLLDPDSLVSMNMFGFTPWIFAKAESYFADFLRNIAPDDLKAEYVLPTLVDTLMHKDGLVVDVLSTHDVWFGVTYPQDKPYVQEQLLKKHQEGVYPDQLF